VQPISFLSKSGISFGTVWEDGEESRILLQMPLSVFGERLKGTVFGENLEEEANAVETTVVTPDDNYIAVKGVGVGNGTTVQFKARSIDLMFLIDDFLRTLR
jgi:hypothetical protein